MKSKNARKLARSPDAASHNWPADAVEKWDIERLIPYARNARTHSEAQVAQLSASIKEFGWTIPALVDEAGGLIAGHGRILAARKLGISEIPVMIARGWSDAKKRAYVIADNRIPLNAGWDQELLAVELDELRDLKFDMSLMGFTPQELNDLIGTPNTGFDPDEAPPAPVDPVSRAGDLWIMSGHRLLAGDSTKAEDVARLMGGAKAALCLTDPPYGISIVKAATVGGGKPVTIAGKRTGTIRAHGASPFGGVKNKRGTVGAANWVDATEYFPVHGDDKPFDPAHLIGMADHHILFGGNYFASRLKDGRCWLVWDKNNTGHFADAELAWTDIDHGVKLYQHTWNGLVREGVRAEELVKRVHPTQKPVGLFAAILEDFSAIGDVVIDPYHGSGTTLIACEKLGRACYAMELPPTPEVPHTYVDVAVMRWQQFTGKQATLDGDGRTFDEIKAERIKVAA